MNPNRCPVTTSDFEIIHRYLLGLPLDELIFVSEEIFGSLSSAEKISYNLNHFCSDYSDVQGRINFIRSILDNAVITTVHIPFSYQRDPRLIDLLRPKVYEYFIPVARELKEEGAALTDELDETPASSITVTNPRWEHVDETRKQESPTVARVGDTVALLVDVSGYPEGAPVTFDIFDKCSDPAMRIETERGKNEEGTARIEWVVDDPNGRGKELQLEFEGSARSKSSGRAPIDLKLEKIYRVELKDEGGNPLVGIEVEFTVPGEEPVIVPTDENGISEHPAEDSTVDADVRILWEAAGAGSGGSDDTTALGGYEILLVDDQDEPMTGIDVCFQVDGVKTTVMTDEKGRAFLAAQGESKSPAEVTFPGVSTPVDQLPDEDPDPDAIQITVIDVDGKPIEGAEVTFTIDGEDHIVYSDTNGKARLEHPDADEALVTIRKLAGETVTPPDPSPYAEIRTRALTDEQVREALQYHINEGDIKLTIEKVPENDDRVSLSEDVVAGVTIMQLVDPFARGTEKTGDTPGQKHERDKFSCKPLTPYHRSLLNQRHALGLVRLCKNWLAPNGYKVFYTQGLNGDTSRKDCHGWGTALDFGGASTELPQGTSSLTVRLGVDFIVYLHWGLIPMWKPSTVAASSNPDDWERLASWTIDDGTDFTKNPPGKKLQYRLDPPPYQKAENGKEPSDAIKSHFQKASVFFRDLIYKFAVQEYSDATDAIGPGVPDSPTTEINSHDGHFILHPDYPKPNEAGSKYGRNAHNNHLHLQLGKTNYDITA